MDRRTKVALGSAVLGGYVLGRTKKGRFALTIATYVAGKGLGVDPKQLVTEGVRRLGEIPQVAELQEQIRGEGLDAAKGALSSVVGRGVGSLGDTISGRAVNLGGKGKPEEPDEDEVEEEEEGEEEPEDAYEDEDEEPEAEEPEDEAEGPVDEDSDEDEDSGETEDEPPSGRRGRDSRAARAKRQPGGGPGGAASRAAKKPAAKAAPAAREAGKTASPRKKAAKASPTRDSRRR
ncbi:histone protein [Streptomyces sp. NPDC002018]|uniref:histone protein n=1 Tax=Streptomyces sp. NPDC002018 TaxID=3364629 RepID=UPI0036968239